MKVYSRKKFHEILFLWEKIEITKIVSHENFQLYGIVDSSASTDKKSGRTIERLVPISDVVDLKFLPFEVAFI